MLSYKCIWAGLGRSVGCFNDQRYDQGGSGGGCDITVVEHSEQTLCYMQRGQVEDDAVILKPKWLYAGDMCLICMYHFGRAVGQTKCIQSARGRLHGA